MTFYLENSVFRQLRRFVGNPCGSFDGDLATSVVTSEHFAETSDTYNRTDKLIEKFDVI